MKIHEYQAKALLKEAGVQVPNGVPIFDLDQVEAAVTELGGGTVVVKAQIHAGGRGKGGGVKVVNGLAEAKQVAGD
ncbi:MAG: succinate--CoA ligase subunit beta, partial [Deltaproteobacteria bacterium]